MSEILVIDDDTATALLIASAVPDFKLLSAQTPVEGLDVVRTRRRSLELIVLDCSDPQHDHGAICLLMRDEAPQLPILPMMSDEQASLRRLLRELHCAEPLSRPIERALVEPMVRAALQQPVPPVPASGLLSWAKQRAREWERRARAEQQGCVLVYATQRRDRIYLRQLLSAAGATVIGEASDRPTLERLVPRACRTPIIVTIAAEAAPLAVYAAIQQLPMLALAPDLISALSLVHNPHRTTAAWPTLGVVLDDPADEAAVPLHLAHALRRLARGEEAIAPDLQAPFADTALSPQEQSTLLLDIQGYDTKAIAAWMNVDVSTIRQYRGRIRDKIGVGRDEPLSEWAEQWWTACANRPHQRYAGYTS